MDKQTLVYTYNGIAHSNKKELTIDTCSTLNDFQRHNTKWKKTVSKGQISYDSIYKTFSKEKRTIQMGNLSVATSGY